jgi:hypothetical protein
MLRFSAIVYFGLFTTIRAWYTTPNTISGAACTSPDGMPGNCVTPDSEQHDSLCRGVNGFIVIQDGICPNAGVIRLGCLELMQNRTPVV